MARKKAPDMADLAAKAEADLKLLKDPKARIEGDGVHKPPTGPNQRHKLMDKLKVISACATLRYEDVAKCMKVSTPSMCSWLKQYREQGLHGLCDLIPPPRQGKLSSEQKETVRDWIRRGVTPKGDPCTWTLERVSGAILDEFGVTMTTSPIWRWFRKEGIKLRVLRPQHYKAADEETKEKFRKRICLYAIHLRDWPIYFFDEARFGLKPILGAQWTTKDSLLLQTINHGYSNFWMFSAVCPQDGDDFSLFLSHVSTDMMSFYLEAFMEHRDGRPCILALDQAGWHRSLDLEIPKGIKFVFIPAHTPELNPVERLWHVLKRSAMRNRFFKNIKEVEDSIMKHYQGMGPAEMATLCRLSYLPQLAA